MFRYWPVATFWTRPEIAPVACAANAVVADAAEQTADVKTRTRQAIAVRMGEEQVIMGRGKFPDDE